MEGAKNPMIDSDEELIQLKDTEEVNPEIDSDEETKDQKQSNSSSKYAHLPSIDFLLEKNGLGKKFG